MSIIKKIHNYASYRQSKAAVKENNALLSRFPINLTRKEMNEVDSMWGFFPVSRKWIYQYASTFKATRGFDKRYVPSCCCYPYIIRSLNHTKDYEILEHKGLTNLYLKDIRQPFAPLRSIYGVYYDSDFRMLSNNECVDYLSEINKTEELIVKPATHSSCGRNISFIPADSSKQTIKEILSIYNIDIVIQTLVKQSHKTAILNPTSVNTFRISTLNLNGNISVVSALIKAGGKGNRVDNVGGGHGGLMVGLNSSGSIITESFSAIGESVEIAINDIPQFNISKINNFAINACKMFPQLGLVGWDIALDENDEPIMIEANLHWPGITVEQLVGGPFFSERTDEVLEFVRHSIQG